MKPESQAYDYYIKLRDDLGMMWDKLKGFFRNRYSSYTSWARSSQQLKDLNFNDFIKTF